LCTLRSKNIFLKVENSEALIYSMDRILVGLACGIYDESNSKNINNLTANVLNASERIEKYKRKFSRYTYELRKENPYEDAGIYVLDRITHVLVDLRYALFLFETTVFQYDLEINSYLEAALSFAEALMKHSS